VQNQARFNAPFLLNWISDVRRNRRSRESTMAAQSGLPDLTP
jgi:hypothetical protein